MVTYVFEIDGFKGAETGQIYYKGSDVAEMDRFLASNNAIRSYNFSNLDLIMDFKTPQAISSPEIIGTYLLTESFNSFREESSSYFIPILPESTK